MKKIQLFSLALAAGMFAACSDDTAVTPDTNSSWNADGKGYVALSINMPSTTGDDATSRANDVFDDGLAAEYACNDATLILFSGADEATATVASVYSLTGLQSNMVSDNVTVQYSKVQQITKPSGDKVYAFVVLNNSGLINIAGVDGASSTFDSMTLVGMTLADFNATAKTLDVATIASVGGSNFLMSNAPVSNVAGGTTAPASPSITTLVEIPATKIYATEAKAQSGEATDIYVERAVAKVTVTNGSSSAAVTGTAITGYTIDGWSMNYTNTKSFFTRNVDFTTAPWAYIAADVTDYRFIGSDPLLDGESVYRPYWGIDPNYDAAPAEGDFTIVSGVPANLLSMGTNAYCLENTFNVEHQNQNETTGVIVKATLDVTGAAEDGSFYVLNNDKSTIYLAAGMLTSVKQKYLQNSTVNSTAQNALTEDSKLGADDLEVTFVKASTPTADGVSTISEAGNYIVKDIHVAATAASKFKESAIPAALASNNATITEAVNANVGNIAYYADGEAYYFVLIRHFDENQTPWSAEDLADANLSGSYPDNFKSKTAEENWLGRYGVLRNNWYNIAVTGIAQIGDAEAPTISGKPDDVREEWIKVRINVLSWAKRSQDAVLGEKW